MKLTRTRLALIAILWLSTMPATKAQPEFDRFIGKPSPDFTFTKIAYFPESPEEISLNYFSGKWLIIDFWTRSCLPCIKSFPTLNHWQEEFKDSLQIVLVAINDHYNPAIESYFDGVRETQHLTLPVAYDSILHTKFGIRTVPHLVIIDPYGIVRGIYENHLFTKEHLSTILNRSKKSKGP